MNCDLFEEFIEISVTMEQNLSIRSGNGEAIYQVNGSTCTLKARWNKGKKEGPATLYDSRRFVFAELVFVNDQITGTCLLRNNRGRLIFRGSVVNGKKEGLCHEYDDTGTRIFYGFYHEGEKHPLLTPNQELSGFYNEKSIQGELLSISEYNETREYKSGHCYMVEKGLLTRECEMEKDIQRHVIREWKNGDMIEYFASGNVEYEGQWKGTLAQGFIREGEGVLYDERGKVKYRGPFEGGKQFYQLEDLKNMPGFRRQTTIHGDVVSVSEYDSSGRKHGRCFLYQDNVVTEECIYVRGKKRDTIRQLEGTEMKIFSNSQLVYQGTYSGDIQMGYKKAGQGDDYENGMVVYHGDFLDDKRHGKGTQYRNGCEWFIGSFKKGVQHGQGRLMNEDGTVMIEGNWKYGFFQTDDGFVDAETGITESPFAPGFMHRWKERGGAAESGQIAVAIVKDAVRRIQRNGKKWIRQHFGSLMALLVGIICAAGDVIFPILLEWHVLFIILCILAGIIIPIVTVIFLRDRLDAKGGWLYGLTPLGVHILLILLGYLVYQIGRFFIWISKDTVRIIVFLIIVLVIVLVILVIIFHKTILKFLKRFKEWIHDHFGSFFVTVIGILCIIGDVLIPVFASWHPVIPILCVLFGCLVVIAPVYYLRNKLDNKGGWKYGFIPIGAHLALVGFCLIVYFFLKNLSWVFWSDGRIITITSILGVVGIGAFLVIRKYFLLFCYIVSYGCFLVDVILPITLDLVTAWRIVWSVSGIVIGIACMIWVVHKKLSHWSAFFLSLEAHCIELEAICSVYMLALLIMKSVGRIDLIIVLILLLFCIIPSFFQWGSLVIEKAEIIYLYPYFILIVSFSIIDSVLVLFFNGDNYLCGVVVTFVIVLAWLVTNSTDWTGYKNQLICQLFLTFLLLAAYSIGHAFYNLTEVSIIWVILLVIAEIIILFFTNSHPTIHFIVTCIVLITLFLISVIYSFVLHLPTLLVIILCILSLICCVVLFKNAYSDQKSLAGLLAVLVHSLIYVVLYLLNLFYQFYDRTKLSLIFTVLVVIGLDIIMALFYFKAIGIYVIQIVFVVTAACVIPISFDYPAVGYIWFILIGIVYWCLPVVWFHDRIPRNPFLALGIPLSWFLLIGFSYIMFQHLDLDAAIWLSSIFAVVTLALLVLWLYERKETPIPLDSIEVDNK